jgi:predicted dehydrogenase
VVGYGSIGKRHLRIARHLLPDADIQVLRHQECVDRPEHSNGCFSSVDSALAFAPQIAVIANPAAFHITVGLPLAKTGVHLLIEKPLAASLDGVEDLIEACRGHNSVLMTAYNLRFLASLQRFRELLNDGVVGRILSVRSESGQYLPSWRPDADYRTSVSSRKDLGGGVLLELSHELDYLRWIFGEVDWVTATTLRQSDLEVDVEDTAHLTLGFAADRSGNRLVATLSIDFIRHDTTRNCTAIGEKGSLRWDALTGVVAHFESGATGWRELFRHQPLRDDSYQAEWKHFISCIDEQRVPLITGEDGRRVLQIIQAARRSAESGSSAAVADRA